MLRIYLQTIKNISYWSCCCVLVHPFDGKKEKNKSDAVGGLSTSLNIYLSQAIGEEGNLGRSRASPIRRAVSPSIMRAVFFFNLYSSACMPSPLTDRQLSCVVRSVRRHTHCILLRQGGS